MVRSSDVVICWYSFLCVIPSDIRAASVSSDYGLNVMHHGECENLSVQASVLMIICVHKEQKPSTFDEAFVC